MGVSKAQQKATRNFQRKTYDTITLKIRKDSGELAMFKELAEKRGEPLAELIKNMLREESKKEGIRPQV